MSFETEVKDPAPTDIIRVKQAISRLRQLEGEKAQKEAELKQLSAQIARVSELEIPAIFDEIGIVDLKLEDGRKVIVKTDVRPSIPEEEKEHVFEWLRGHNFGSIIKNEVKVAFGMGEDAPAAALIERLALEGLNVDHKTSIHPSTLASWVREQQSQGAPIPDGLNVNPFRKTIIK